VLQIRAYTQPATTKLVQGYEHQVLHLRLVGDPLVGDGHEVALHGEREALSVLGGLDDGGLGLASYHTHTLAHALHLLNDVVLWGFERREKGR